MKLEYLEKILSTGRVSVVATIDFTKLNNGKIVFTPILSLRARNINRDMIDLFSFKTQCASLEENDCYYDISKRPSGGVVCIPRPKNKCYSEVNRLEELKKWLPYQKVLERIVKRHTKMSVVEKLKEDVELTIYNFLSENYQDSMDLEIEEMKYLMPTLIECFPEQYLKATIKNELNTKKKTRKKSK